MSYADDLWNVPQNFSTKILSNLNLMKKKVSPIISYPCNLKNCQHRNAERDLIKSVINSVLK
jgi:hypothetical protein